MQRDLVLIRHAKSSWKEHGISDHDRTLNKRGKHDAPLMAGILKQKNIIPDLLISSTAVRAKMTAELFAEVYDIKRIQIHLTEDLYLADENEILNTVKHFSQNVKTAFLFSHNPGITEFANLLCNSKIENIPTCGVCHVLINADGWREVEFGKGILAEFDYPKNHYQT